MRVIKIPARSSKCSERGAVYAEPQREELDWKQLRWWPIAGTGESRCALLGLKNRGHASHRGGREVGRAIYMRSNLIYVIAMITLCHNLCKCKENFHSNQHHVDRNTSNYGETMYLENNRRSVTTKKRVCHYSSQHGLRSSRERW